MTSMRPSRLARAPVATTLAGGLCTSASPVFVGLAAVSASTAGFFRFSLSLPILVPLAFADRRGGTIRAHLNVATVAAGALLAGDVLLWNEAIADSGAGVATVIVNAQVIIVPLLAWTFLGERPGKFYALAMPFMLLGVGLASGVIGESSTGHDPTQGALLALGAAACYGVFVFLLRQTGDSEGDATVAPVLIVTAAAGLLTLTVAPLWHGLDFTPSITALAWLFALAATGQVIAYLLIAPALPRLSSSVGAALLVIQPVGSIVLATIVLGERPSALQLSGCVLVLAALYVAMLGSPAHQQRSSAHVEGATGSRQHQPGPTAGTSEGGS